MNNAMLNKTAMLWFFLLAALAATQVFAQSGYDLFQKGLVKERAQGDLKAAIQIYERIVKQYPNDRELAAKSLVEMGNCYEQLGKSEARNAYERVLRDYADQNAEVNEARVRLTAIEHGARGSEMSARRLWAGAEVDIEGAVTADGRYLTYVDWSTGDLAVRDLVTGQNRDVTHKGSWADSDEFAENSVPSPDGRQIAYAWFNKDDFYELRVVGADGSNPRTVYRNPKTDYLEPKSWSPDGKKIVGAFWLAGTNKVGIMEVSVADGSARTLKVFKSYTGHPNPNAMFSPDGRFIAYDFRPSDNSPAGDVWISSADGDSSAPLVEHPADDYLLGWAPDGKSVIFASDRTGSYGLWALDVVDGKPSGSPRLLKADLGQVWPLGLSRNGSLHYGLQTGVHDLYIASFDFSDGKLLNAPTPVVHIGPSGPGAWSPDGKYLAYMSSRHSLRLTTIVIRSLETGRERELTPRLDFMFPGYGVRWSCDGRSLEVNGIEEDGGRGVFKVDAETGDTSLLLKASPGTVGVNSEELPGGSSLVALWHEHTKEGEVSKMVVHNLQTGLERELVSVLSPPVLAWFSLSPDSSQVAFTTVNEPGGTSMLRVVPVAGGEARNLLQLRSPEIFLFSGGPAWTPDGRYIVFAKATTLSGQGKIELWEISAQGGAPRSLGLSMANIQFRGNSIHPDGHRLVFDAGANEDEVWEIQNFLPALKASR